MVMKKWTIDDIPDQTGKIAVVTGANSGIGFEVTKALAGKGAQVIMGCRNPEKAEKAKNEIITENPNAKLEIIQLDLADLKSIQRFADELNKKYQQLNILCNNAGVMMITKQKTADGFEYQLGTNHLGHFTLTGLLLDTLLKTKDSRIVNMSSFAHLYGKMDFNNLQWEKGYSKLAAYTRSKLANLLFTYELQRKLETSGKKTICLASHPGWTRTNLQRYSGFFRFLNPIFGQKQSMGALPMLYAATAADVQGGGYYGPRGLFGMRGYPKKVKSNKRSHNMKDAKKLWEVSEELTKVKYNI